MDNLEYLLRILGANQSVEWAIDRLIRVLSTERYNDTGYQPIDGFKSG